MSSLKESLIKASIMGAYGALKVTPDPLLRRGSDYLLRDIPYPEGRDFLGTMVLVAKHNLGRAAPPVRQSVLNFLANIMVKGEIKRQKFAKEAGFSPPVLMVISPTMRCNLDCYGCYAGKYSQKGDLGMDTLEGLIEEAEEMGIYLLTISGGEPFILPELPELLGEHPDIMFQIYTNGTLIDKGVAQRLARAGNVFPAISVEGFEKETDDRRGEGTHKKILAAMDNLRRAGVFFGFSATATKDNNDLLVTDEFVDFYRQRGCVLGWYFHYVPVGKEPGMSLMPSPEQRAYRREQLLKLRSTRNIILADFWNDGPLVGGCLAGGRTYLHINSKGDVEPCVFVHFAVDNIKEKSLKEALRSPFFAAIRERQPYSDNLLRPCMIIDLPEVLRDVVSQHHARPTHPGAEAVINDLSEDLDAYAGKYAEMADKTWGELCAHRNPACH